MIAVIADDLTGAAEIGGIGLRYNLTVEVITDAELEFSNHADILVINTNTRSMDKDEAKKVISDVCEFLKTGSFDFIFKKIDSVLRGHIATEIEVQLKSFNQLAALIIPANPSLGRTIENKTYFINGVPIHETDFANDPEFPITNSSIEKMLTGTDLPVFVNSYHDKIEDEGLIIGEANSNRDLDKWARLSNSSMLLAGSSSFFSALLAQKYKDLTSKRREHILLDHPVLYVCGSKFHKSTSLVHEIASKGGPVSFMPTGIFTNYAKRDDLFENWKNEILEFLNQHGKVVVAIDSSLTKDYEFEPKVLRQHMALVISKLFSEIHVKELVIEGGATASEILKRLEIKRLSVAQEIASGLTRSIAHDKKINITLKPGSYPWTADIWKL